MEQFGSQQAGGGVGLTIRNSIELDMSKYLTTYHQDNLYHYSLTIKWTKSGILIVQVYTRGIPLKIFFFVPKQ